MHLLYYFIGGMVSWGAIIIIHPIFKQEVMKTKSNKEKNRIFFLSLFSSFLHFLMILALILLGLILNYHAFSMLVNQLSTVMFNAYSPGAIEYKDFLGIFVQITSLFGTVSIAVAAYIFKKKS